MSRDLTIVPILHLATEVFTPNNTRIQPYVRNRAIRFWSILTPYIKGLPLTFDNLRVYQDSLPHDPGFSESVSKTRIDRFLDTEFAHSSPNLRLLKWLGDQGAKIMGTESIELLKRDEVALMTRDHEKMDIVLKQRDAAIAKRISSTLLDGETALLFIGFTHNVAEHLPSDIRIEIPSVVEDFFRNNNEGEQIQDFSKWRRI